MNARGFTLVEALVALAVLATVLASVYGVFGSGLRTLSRGDARLTLALTAESLLNRAGLDLTAKEPEASGSLPDGVTWRVTKQPFDPALLGQNLTVVEATPPPRLPGQDVDLLKSQDGNADAAQDNGQPAGGSGFQTGTPAAPGGSNAGSAGAAKLRAWILTAAVANAQGESFTLSRLSLERAP